jgi:hypothetical protein
MSAWNTNVLPFEPVYYVQPSARHMQAPVGYYHHPTRDIVTSVCDAVSTFLKHPLSETFVQPKSPSVVELIPKLIENERLVEHIQNAISAIRVAYEKNEGATRHPTSDASKPHVATDHSKCNGVNVDAYPQRLVLTFQCDWAVDGIAVLHIDPVKPAVLTITSNNADVRIIDIESVVCCDMEVYVSHRFSNKQCFVFLDQVNEADLVDQLDIHVTVLRESVPQSYVLRCK